MRIMCRKDAVMKFILRDGSVYVGRVVSVLDDTVVFYRQYAIKGTQGRIPNVTVDYPSSSSLNRGDLVVCEYDVYYNSLDIKKIIKEATAEALVKAGSKKSTYDEFGLCKGDPNGIDFSVIKHVMHVEVKLPDGKRCPMCYNGVDDLHG